MIDQSIISRFECIVCKKKYRTRSALRMHDRKVHLKTPTTFCPECNKGLYSPADLKNHMVVHTGIYNYPCDLCPSKFFRSDRWVTSFPLSVLTWNICSIFCFCFADSGDIAKIVMELKFRRNKLNTRWLFVRCSEKCSNILTMWFATVANQLNSFLLYLWWFEDIFNKYSPQFTYIHVESRSLGDRRITKCV